VSGEREAARGDGQFAVALRGGEVRRSGMEAPVLYYALVFLLVGLVAGALGLTGIAHVAGQIAWILLVIGVVLLVVHLLRGGSARTL